MEGGRKAGPDELFRRFPDVADTAEVVPVRFRALSSAAVGPADWLALHAVVHEAAAREAPLHGLVLTPAPPAPQETPYFLDPPPQVHARYAVAVSTVTLHALRAVDTIARGNLGLCVLRAVVRLRAQRRRAGEQRERRDANSAAPAQ